MTPNEEKDVSWSSPKRHLTVPLDQSGGGNGAQIWVFGDQDPWWQLGKGEVNTLRTSHLGSFISTRWLTIVKKRGVVHKFSMHFCKPTELLWLFRVKQNLQPYITPICTMRNSKKGNRSLLSWLDFIYHNVWVLISRGVEIVGDGEWLNFSTTYQLNTNDPLSIFLLILNHERTKKGVQNV